MVDLIAARYPERVVYASATRRTARALGAGLPGRVTLTVRPRKDTALSLAPPRAGRLTGPAPV